MPKDRVIKTAFLISFVGHCLLLGTPGFNLRLPQHEKQPEELTVELKIERPALLPKIDIMGQEKKFKEVEQKPEQPKPELKPSPLPEQITVQQISQERIKEKVDVIDHDNDAMLRYQDMVKQKIEEARRYPLWAKKQGIEGVVFLNFIILPNGSSQDVKIIRSSGSGILDEAAVETVKRAVPFPSIPKEISSSFVKIGVSIVFILH
ncbi:MAG: energy transducer TonB [Candidatus Omnitrophota bacterium]|nr:energy transducer TonB [Candidatus Omnitrophota bacterium]